MNQKIVIVYSTEEIPEIFERLYLALTSGSFEDYYREKHEDVHTYITNININLDIRFVSISNFYDKDIKKDIFFIIDLHKSSEKYCKQIKKIRTEGKKNICILKDVDLMCSVNTENLVESYDEIDEVKTLSLICHIMRRFHAYIIKSSKQQQIFMSYRWNDKNWKKIVHDLATKHKLDVYIDEFDTKQNIREINSAIKKSIGMLILYHDTYGSSYYTVKEVTQARNQNMPMVIIQTGTNEISRILQQTGNLRMFLNNSDETSEISVLKSFIHIFYMNISKIMMLKSIKKTQHIHYLPFQPTLYDIANDNIFKKKVDNDRETKECVIYPEPIMIRAESEKFEKILNFFGDDSYELKTVLQYQIEEKKSETSDKIIQLSASNVMENLRVAVNGRTKTEVIDFFKLLIKYLFNNGNNIGYMGSLSSNYIPNYTKMIFNAASEYNNQFLKTKDKKNNKQIVYIAEHNRKLSDERVMINGVEIEQLETQDDATGRIVFAKKCDILITIGGKKKDNENSGVIIEILEYYKKKKPIFIIPDFSGASYHFSKFIRSIIEENKFLDKAIETDLTGYIKTDYKKTEMYQTFLEIMKLETVDQFYNNNLNANDQISLEDCDGNYYEKIKLIIKGVNRCKKK